MNSFEKSLKMLDKFLAETSVEERDSVWAEVKKMGISGPTVSEYFDSVQIENENFNNSFCSIGTLQEASYYQKYFERIRMGRKIKVDHVINVETVASDYRNLLLSETDLKSLTGENTYAMAA